MRKHTLLSLTITLALAGCEVTQTPPTQAVYQPAGNDAASPEEVVDALTVMALGQDNLETPDIEPEPVFDDVWHRIRYQLSIDVPQNRPVVAERNYYARHQKYLDRIAKRAEPYLYFIVEEVEKRQMPIEIALLPIVESAFDPFGYSHRSASGIWQFIPVTGERFDLKQNWWVDGRRDIVQSTRAALDYLSYLHKLLGGDWLNAIAAYNSGEGRVLRAIKKNRRKHLPTDFWSLDLPRETTQYVPKLLALSDLLKRSDEFGVSWQKIVNAQVVDVVDVGSQIDLALAAEMADMTVTELYRLNPGFNRWATDPDGPHTLLLPIDKIAGFKSALAKTDAKDRLRWQRYEVKRGDTLGGIAKKFNASVGAIQTLNELDNHIIRVGQGLLIPLSGAAIDNKQLSRKMIAASNQSRQIKKVHRVQSGDTLWDIANEYDVTIADLAKWNRLKKNGILRLGQKLTVYTQGTQASTPLRQEERTITYKVRRGDSLARIASQFNLLVSDIVKWNKLDKRKYLQPGQKLKLKVDVKKT